MTASAWTPEAGTNDGHFIGAALQFGLYPPPGGRPPQAGAGTGKRV